MLRGKSEKSKATMRVQVQGVFSALPSLLSVASHIWIDLDEAADVLYISFRKPQQANDSVMENNLVYHYDGEQLVGMAIIGARCWRNLPSREIIEPCGYESLPSGRT